MDEMKDCNFLILKDQDEGDNEDEIKDLHLMNLKDLSE